MMRLSSNSFICKYNNCKKYLKEPIILPCGRSICREHVDNLSKNKSESFLKCNLCDQIHKKTDDFQLNVTLKELLEEGTHLDEKQIEMRQLYDNFELTLKELDRIKRDPNNYLFDYVNEQKRKVELQREELKLQIDKIAEDLIKKIDDLNASLNSKIIDDPISHKSESIYKSKDKSQKLESLRKHSEINNSNINSHLNDHPPSKQNNILKNEHLHNEKVISSNVKNDIKSPKSKIGSDPSGVKIQTSKN